MRLVPLDSTQVRPCARWPPHPATPTVSSTTHLIKKPSSKKKNSKPPTSLSNGEGEGTASPQSAKLPSSSNSELSEENLLDDAIAEASCKYPHLIGKSASIGKITDVETNETIGCKIWMSEPYMVASSIVPGSTVSVSLASSRNEFSNGFPLSSFSSEYAQNKGFDVVEKMPNEAGIYFALATVYSSSKVTGNGVRLSWQLSCTMGCPTPERSLFIFPVQTPASTVLKNGFDGFQNRQILFQNCKELCLELAAANEFTTNPPVRKSHNLLEERFPSSPRTPMHRSRISSPSTPFSSSSREESVANSLKEVTSVVDSVDTVKLLEDESTKKLLQTCASSFLYKRYLLQGNIVVLPLLPKLCIFRVVGARQVSDHKKIQDTGNESSRSLSSIDAYDSDAYHAFAVTSGTKIYLRLPDDMSSEIRVPHAKHEDKFGDGNVEGDNLRLGGLLNESTILKDIIVSSCLKNTMSSFGLRATKGVLLHGPPGTGKTCLARFCARDTCINFFCINGPEIVGQYHGESEQALREVFESAGRATPAVVFIDELDAIAPARKEGSEELSQRMVATLLTLMDGIGSSDGLLVISATNRPDSIEPALRRPGRFDREIEIGVPSPNQRLEILLTYLNQMDHNLSDAQIQQLALSTHGFVGADLAALCNEAALFCLRRYHKLKNSYGGSFSKTLVNSAVGPDGTVENSNSIRCKRDLQQNHSCDSYCSSEIVSDDEIIQSASYIGNGGTVDGDFTLKIVLEDFEKARMKVRPSAMREVILEVPKVKWEDIGGLKEVKNQLMEAVEWPQKHQDALNRIGTRPPRGVLMFGPPGCSKTLMARAVASEAGLNFLAVKGPELFSKWVGESEKAVRSVFAKARANAPSIVFFDEIDGLAAIRGKESDGVSVSDRVMSQLLVELDGMQQRIGVTVIAATNRPDKIDSALLRPGRFDRLVYVGPPNEADRQEIFGIHLRKIPCSCNVNVKELGCLTESFTGADISLVCREAAIAAIEENLDATEVTMQHLTDAIKQVRPSEVGESDYQELSGKFQRLVLSSAKS